MRNDVNRLLKHKVVIEESLQDDITFEKPMKAKLNNVLFQYVGKGGNDKHSNLGTNYLG